VSRLAFVDPPPGAAALIHRLIRADPPPGAALIRRRGLPPGAAAEAVRTFSPTEGGGMRPAWAGASRLGGRGRVRIVLRAGVQCLLNNLEGIQASGRRLIFWLAGPPV